MIVQEPLQAAVWHCLNNYAYSDAVFLAERLLAEVGSSESVCLLASCLHRSGETVAAHRLLRSRGPESPHARYLLALTAHALDRLQEAESVLVEGLGECGGGGSVALLLSSAPPNSRLVQILVQAATKGYGVYASFALRLLGECLRATQRSGRACVAYRAALTLNPFLYTAYTTILDYYTEDKTSSDGCGANNKSGSNPNSNKPPNIASYFSDDNNKDYSCGDLSSSNILSSSSTSGIIDTNPENIFTLDHLSDLSTCHGTTLCSLLNSSNTAFNSTTSNNNNGGSNISGSNTSDVGGNNNYNNNNNVGNLGGGSNLINSQSYSTTTSAGNLSSSTTMTNSAATSGMTVGGDNFSTPFVGVSTNMSSLYTPIATAAAATVTASHPQHHVLQQQHQAPRKQRRPQPVPHKPSQQQLLFPLHTGVTPVGVGRAASPYNTPSFGVLPGCLSFNTNPKSVHHNASINSSALMLSPLVFSPLNVTDPSCPSSASVSVAGSSVPTTVVSALNAPTNMPAPVKSPLSTNMTRRVLCRSSVASVSVASSSAPVAATTAASSQNMLHSSGNTGGYHHSPSSTLTNPRRSSRLFGSVKENSKLSARSFGPGKGIGTITAGSAVTAGPGVGVSPGGVGVAGVGGGPKRNGKPRSLRHTVVAVHLTDSSGHNTNQPGPHTSLSTTGPSTTLMTEINNARNTSLPPSAGNMSSSPSPPSSITGGDGENIMPGGGPLPPLDVVAPPTTGPPSTGGDKGGDLQQMVIHTNKDQGDVTKLQQHMLPPTAATVVVSQEQLLLHALRIQKCAAEGLMALLRQLGTAYYHLSRYDCTAAIECYTAVHSSQRTTSHVYQCMAMAYFHNNDFKAAVRYFTHALSASPHGLVAGLEYHSTALWHLQKEVELSGLAHDLLASSKQKAQAWCALGNCFSLQKEHETAIKYFSRAVQVEPTCAYAYTLLGHEHIATEELDRATACYRTAIRLSPRHYNAWYGIGLVLYRREKFSHAEIHFRKALSIHPNSCVLLCHIAVVQQALGASSAALATLSDALSRDSGHSMCRYHRAAIYLDLDQPQLALTDLKVLQPTVPREANVHLLMGRAYSKLGDLVQAQHHLSWALDLDPKGQAGQSGVKDDLPSQADYMGDDDNNQHQHEQAEANDGNNDMQHQL